MTSISAWSIIVASVVSIVIGSIWYSPMLFGKYWMEQIKMGEADIAEAKTRGMWKLYAIQFITTLISFAVLAFLVSATGSATAGDGMFLGFISWLGFAAPVGVAGLLWKKQSGKLFLIETFCTAIILIIGGAIIGAWR